MSKIEELQKKVDELQKELDELKEKEKEKESGGVWRPEFKEEYWYIDSFGKVTWTINVFNYEDNARFSIGNVFKTREDAEFAVEKLKVLAELKVFAEPKDREWDGENQHWSIWHNAREDRVYAECWRVGKTNSIYFKSKEKAKQAIDAIGEDRIKKYYLEV